ncbi:MAG: hypothetical protein JWN70_1147 [Planctomycetaceae bacterium]|nr:hypothetical protein [Planctomycetaceae bacterium]
MVWPAYRDASPAILTFWPRRGKARRSLSEIKSLVEQLEQRLVLTVSSDEQLFVYLLNQIRHNPQAYDTAANLGGILDDVEARQPLAVNDDLFESSEVHAQEMADHDYFAHHSPITGEDPNELARDAGYDLPDFFPDDDNFIESIAAGNALDNPADTIKLLIVDPNTNPPGHRIHLLGMDDFNAQANEIGVAHAFNLLSTFDHYWAAHITFSDPENLFLTGVVYEDVNTDSAFSLNEGLAGVTVSIGGTNLETVTNAAGGWSIQVPGPGTYTVSVAGGDFVGPASTTVQVTNLNREIDFTSGIADGVIDFGTPPAGANEPPVNTLPVGPIDVTEDVTLNLTGISVTDPDVGINPVSVTLDVLHGKLQINTNVTNGLTSGQVVGNNSGHVVVTAPLAKINATLAALSGITYRGTTDFNGDDTLTMVTNDQQTDDLGGAMSDTDTLDLTIAAVNDAPVNTVPSGTVSVITETATRISGLSLADSDLGTNDALVTLTVTHGTVAVRTDVASGLTAGDIAGNGTTSVTITAPRSRLLATYAATNGVTYTSDNGYIGSDVLTVTSSDQGQAGSGGTLTDTDTVAIQVQPAPVAPVLTVPAAVTGPAKGKPVIIGAGATLSDPDSPNYSGGKLTIQITSVGTSNDKLTLTKLGTKTGQVNLSGTKVRLGKTVIGSLSGGTNGSPLVIQFSSNVSLAAVQSVLQRVTLKGAHGKLPPGTRTIQFTATDPTHLTSEPQSRQVVIPA